METTIEQLRIDRRFGNAVREGRWVVPARIDVTLAAANARLDFTEAQATTGLVDMTVDIGIGSTLTLIVPPGVRVVAEDLVTRLGHYDVRRRSAGATPVSLVIRVSGRLHGGGDLVVR
ncbi:hypothetical protein ACQP00_39455 [Dactylosporangium sp. CS-047395]|uniref:hypothetical protein n=1 Tax=Dactylosporangium sp. CS-047395 TaxID=3239936 RepID=UPI003D8B95E7